VSFGPFVRAVVPVPAVGDTYMQVPNHGREQGIVSGIFMLRSDAQGADTAETHPMSDRCNVVGPQLG
jgi:hypothetical protein